MVRPFDLARSSLFNEVLRFLLTLRPSTLAPTGSLPHLKDDFELHDDEGAAEAMCPAVCTVTDEQEVFVLNYFSFERAVNAFAC